jgi:hypothetical protein
MKNLVIILVHNSIKNSFVCILNMVLMFLFCTSKTDFTRDTLYIDPVEVHDSLLWVTISNSDIKEQNFKKNLELSGHDSIKFSDYFDIIFRYRVPALLPLYFRILNSQDVHLYFKLGSIYVIGETGSTKNFNELIFYWKSEKNDLVREYLASALGKISDSSQVPVLKELLIAEKNAYVRKTLEAGISRANGGRRTKFSYLPLVDTVIYRKIKTYPSDITMFEYSLIARKKIDTTISHYIPIADKVVFPHMQYKKCRSIYEKVKQPFSSFGLPGVCHVGEDSGWLFDGMPVHSIMGGRVVLIQHEESWGCLVCIESMLPDSQIVCTYYGHLSSNLDVTVGKLLQAGDKIGEIGPPFSLENGGYRSHLHLGIEKASIGNAVIAGYDERIDHWYNPVEFIFKN